MSEANTSWDIQLAYGDIAEKLVRALLIKGGIEVEVKHDRKNGKTGNVAIEHLFRGNPSGIAATKAGWFAIALGGTKFRDEVVVFMKTDRLKRLVAKYTIRDAPGGDNKWTMNFLMPTPCLLYDPEE